MENMIIFLTPLADHFTCFKQKLLKKILQKTRYNFLCNFLKYF